MDDETAARFLISEEHNATDHAVYRIIPLASDPAPPDVFPTRAEAEQWIADWYLIHGVGQHTDQTDEQR